ncbi:MAG: AAA family ATPase [Deltaproteobacteria bacterium]|nr:AAA family ATPase [Deltaproteobacteria bacterium]
MALVNALQRRLVELARLVSRARAVPRVAGHVQLEMNGQQLDLLLADATLAGPGFAAVDWRRAPIAQAFFVDGRAFELEAGGQELRGRVLSRALLQVEQGRLVSAVLDTSGGSPFRCAPDGTWTATRVEVAALHPRPRSLRSRLSIPAEVVLDEAQRRAVELPPGRPVLVLGEAGSGKTTVALHRLAHLKRTAGCRRAALIVPTEGLCGLLEALLARMQVRGVEVWTYERWAAKWARRVFPDLPRRESQDASAAVIQLKRHAAVRELLARAAQADPALPEDEDEPVVPSPALARWHDLQRLFGDRAVLARLVEASQGVLRAGAVAEAFEHTHVQFSPAAEEEFAHIDRARLETLDGRRLDDGTPTQDAGSVDAEDFAILFELDRLRAERRKVTPVELPAYDCLVVDEAQELAPLELTLLGRCLAPGGTLIVAGDAEQQVDPTNHFLGWPGVMAGLGLADWETTTLDVSYRCPADVTDLARRVVGRSLGGTPGGGGRRRRAARRFVEIIGFATELHEVTWLVQALRALGAADPKAAVAIICRSAESAHRLALLLRKGVPVRLALEGHFALRSGVAVTCVQEVKGLEFDHVIVPDASAEAYPDTAESRRALYVAVTRPTRQLVVAWHGERSPIAFQEPGP